MCSDAAVEIATHIAIDLSSNDVRFPVRLVVVHMWVLFVHEQNGRVASETRGRKERLAHAQQCKHLAAVDARCKLGDDYIGPNHRFDGICIPKRHLQSEMVDPGLTCEKVSCVNLAICSRFARTFNGLSGVPMKTMLRSFSSVVSASAIYWLEL